MSSRTLGHVLGARKRRVDRRVIAVFVVECEIAGDIRMQLRRAGLRPHRRPSPPRADRHSRSPRVRRRRAPPLRCRRSPSRSARRHSARVSVASAACTAFFIGSPPRPLNAAPHGYGLNPARGELARGDHRAHARCRAHRVQIELHDARHARDRCESSRRAADRADPSRRCSGPAGDEAMIFEA